MRLLKQAAFTSGLFRASMTLRPTSGVCVLCYHAVRAADQPPPDMPFSGLHVPVSRLDEELGAIRRLATPISAELLRQVLAGARPAPPRAVHVTFDDGYRSVFTRALPLFERHDVPASLFICTTPVERGQLLWYDAAARARGMAEVERVRRDPATDWPAVIDRWAAPASAADELAPLSPDDVAALGRHPLIEIGGHTRTHPRLSALDAGAQRAEVEGCLASLASWTGRRPTSFAYPTGRPVDDYDARTVAIVKEAGANLAFSTERAWAGARWPTLEVPRFVITDGVDGVELAYRIAWAWAR